MKFAYADPPYIGQAKRHYSHDPNCAEVDHQELVNQMLSNYDGWALSLSSPTLKQILNYCPDDVRVGSWVKPWGKFIPNVNPAYVWEPVVFYGGRKRGREVQTIRDFHIANATMKKGLAGAKPQSFCFWIFEFLGMLPDDEFFDLYPGTGAVTKAWESWKRQFHHVRPNKQIKSTPTMRLFSEDSMRK